MVNQKPLDLLASVILQNGISEKITEMIFVNYDHFLAALNDPEKRKHLESLTYENAKTDELFAELRTISHNFQEGLRALFFDENKDLARLTQVYAIF